MNWLESLRHHHLDTPENILFMLGIEYQEMHPGLFDHICAFKDAQKLGNLYTEVINGKIRIKEEYCGNDLRTFSEALIKHNMGAKGHLANELEYSIGIGSKETQFELNRLRLEFPDLNIDHVAEVISEYYQKGSFLKKLHNFLRDDIRMSLL
jgi:hypothetical protein